MWQRKGAKWWLGGAAVPLFENFLTTLMILVLSLIRMMLKMVIVIILMNISQNRLGRR